ncbi:hypothetical protein ACQRIT_001795 [Beauveria bassiana]
MKRCTTDVPRRLHAYNLACSGRRWTSHSSTSLTDEALLEKVGARLNEDEYGDKITIDAKNKTITTEGGELPMSPLFDPAWIKSRRRQAKEAPRTGGQFQKHLQRNPFAQALATPLRLCAVTKTQQPRYFMQRFDVVRHPETNQGWFAPSNDSYGHIQRNEQARASAASPEAEASAKATTGGQDEHAPRVTAYVASQKSVLDALSGPSKRLRGAVLARRRGLGVSPEAAMPVWRHDMGDLVLGSMRHEATDELIRRAGVANHKFVQPCAGWEDIKDVERRGCVLWLPRGEDKATARQHATFDVAGAKYDSKMPVHDLVWLLGEEESARLGSESDVFRDQELLVLKSWPTKTMVQLHLLLWKLQGYLDSASE